MLGNGLQYHDVDVTVYERDQKDSEREEYQIRLGESAMIGFRAGLRDQDIAAIAKEFRAVFGIWFDGAANHEFSMQGDPQSNSGTPSYAKSFAIGRAVLHDILLNL